MVSIYVKAALQLKAALPVIDKRGDDLAFGFRYSSVHGGKNKEPKLHLFSY